jgi:hypothetical protein
VTVAITLASVSLALVLFALVPLLVLYRSAARSPVNSRLRSRVVVTLKSGAAFDGVLFEAGRSAWVLRSAHALGAGENGTNVAVDGEVLILTGDIDFAQRP